MPTVYKALTLMLQLKLRHGIGHHNNHQTKVSRASLAPPESNPWLVLNLLKVSSVSLSMDNWRILRVQLELEACKDNRRD